MGGDAEHAVDAGSLAPYVGWPESVVEEVDVVNGEQHTGRKTTSQYGLLLGEVQ